MLLIESNATRREQLKVALRTGGCAVFAVARIADVVRWPVGDAVVTDVASFTPLWKEVGATHVIVLADSPAVGLNACANGASAWVPRLCTPHVLLSALRTLGVCPPDRGADVDSNSAA
jgi:hypothetical protein